MAITHTNRKGQTYTLYKGQTKTGKPRYYFACADKNQDEPVTELPAGFAISESVNGVVSLAKDRPALILPEEVAVVEDAVKQLSDARRYRVAVKHNQIEIYERFGLDYETLTRKILPSVWVSPDHAKQVQSELEQHAQYTPVLRFTLVDPVQRLFGVERMCYLGHIDGWLDLFKTESVGTLADALIPTLGTEEFFELW
jgi:hypothetical protein